MAKETNGKTSLSLLFEQFAPIGAAIITLVLLMIFAAPIAEKFMSKQWNAAGLYSAIFDWSAIQTGFSFGVYGFILGKSDGFVKEIRGTKAMTRFVSYIKRANIAGFTLTITSIPLVISEISISIPYSTNYIVVALWFSLFFWSFFSFLRIAYNFGQIASVTDKDFHGA